MRVLFVGALIRESRTRQRLRALEEMGHDVTSLSTVPPSVSLDERPAISARIAWRLGTPADATRVNAAIARNVRRTRPDVLWVEKGNTVWPWTLAGVKRASPATRVVSYSEDDMMARHNRSLFYTWGLKHYDCVFTTKSYNCNREELPRLGARRVVFVDKAYDRHAHRPIAVTAADVEALGGDVGFIGSYERERADSLVSLARAGIDVRVWGTGDWGKCAGASPRLRIEGRPLLGEGYVKALCATRINLCFLRKMNRDLQTDRTMEIPASGAFMLAERTEEHLRLFREGREAVYFGSDEELADRAAYYLEHESERATIARAGRLRCLGAGYSHHDRLQEMLEIVAHTGADVGRSTERDRRAPFEKTRLIRASE